MSHMQSQVASHLVRNHRRLRRRLPDLHRQARLTEGPTPDHMRMGAANHALMFLDREVLAQADVEDQVVDRYLDGRATRGSAARLLPQHDTLREAAAGLHDYVEIPTESTDVAGMLHGITGVLRQHLQDEWTVLLPALSRLTETACATCEPLATSTLLERPSARVHLPMSFENAQRLITQHPAELRTRLSEAAVATIRRHAQRLDIQVRDDLRLLIDLVPAVQSEKLGLHVGTMEVAELETVVSPVEFELTFSPLGEGFTELEAHHVLTPHRPLPDDAPAHELTQAAFHAMVGELAAIAGGHIRVLGYEDRAGG